MSASYPSPAQMKMKMMISFLLLGWALAAWAGPPTVLDWQSCVQEAAANNSGLRTARANLNAAAYSAKGAYSGYLPQLSAGASYDDISGNIVNTNASQATYNTSVSLTQNLFAGYQDQAKVAQGAANREAATASLAVTKAQLSQDLKDAFIGLKYAQDNVLLTEQIMSAHLPIFSSSPSQASHYHVKRRLRLNFRTPRPHRTNRRLLSGVDR